MTRGQAVTPGGREKEHTHKEQGEVLNFVVRKDSSKVQASSTSNRITKTCCFPPMDKAESLWKNTRTGQCFHSIRLRKFDKARQKLW